ncbi:ATP-binding protein, partial [Corynebacterium sanguinis]|nr:ATP-binding protein [Corynebacterium sanguinis]
TSQFEPQDWYKSLHDAVIAESILNRIVAGAEILPLDGPNMRRPLADAQ